MLWPEVSLCESTTGAWAGWANTLQMGLGEGREISFQHMVTGNEAVGERL